MATDSRDPIGVDALRCTVSSIRAALERVTTAYTQSVRAWENGSPNFMERIETLRQQTETLATDLDTAIGPIDPHRGATQRNGEPIGTCK